MSFDPWMQNHCARMRSVKALHAEETIPHGFIAHAAQITPFSFGCTLHARSSPRHKSDHPQSKHNQRRLKRAASTRPYRAKGTGRAWQHRSTCTCKKACCCAMAIIPFVPATPMHSSGSWDQLAMLTCAFVGHTCLVHPWDFISSKHPCKRRQQQVPHTLHTHCYEGSTSATYLPKMQDPFWQAALGLLHRYSGLEWASCSLPLSSASSSRERKKNASQNKVPQTTTQESHQRNLTTELKHAHREHKPTTNPPAPSREYCCDKPRPHAPRLHSLLGR